MDDPVIHIDICGQDRPRSHRFYRGLSGWNVTPGQDGRAVLHTGATTEPSGATPVAMAGPDSWVSCYVAVAEAEFDKCLVRAEELGGAWLAGPMPMGEIGAFALVSDPDGNMPGLITMARPG